MSSPESVLLIGVCSQSSSSVQIDYPTDLSASKASGNLGAHVLDAFANSPYKVSIMTREGSTSTFREGIPVLRADYTSQAQLEAAMKGQDIVICMVAIFATGGQQILVDAAIAAGVKVFLPSEFGPPSRDDKFAALHPALPPKVATVDYLKSKGSMISWSAIVTGAFFDWGMRLGLFGFDLKARTATIVDGGSAIFTASTLPTIAQAILAMLHHRDETKNQYVFTSSFHNSQNEILEVLERLDGQKWEVKHVSSEDLATQGNQRLAEEDEMGAIDIVGAGALGRDALGDSRPWGMWDERLGVNKGDLEQAVIQALLEVRAG